MSLAKRLAVGVALLSASATTASAFPASAPGGYDQASPGLEAVHHKPGHQGGPPWARARDDDRRAAYSGRVTRRVCETRTRTIYDPYEDDYVRRQIQECRDL